MSRSKKRKPSILKTTRIPSGVYDLLVDHFETTKGKKFSRLDRAIMAVDFLFGKMVICRQNDWFGYWPVSKKFKEHLLNSDHKGIWSELVNLGIFEEYEYLHPKEKIYTYSTKRGICKHYRIAPSLQYTVLVNVEYRTGSFRPQLEVYQEGLEEGLSEEQKCKDGQIKHKCVEVLKRLDFKRPVEQIISDLRGAREEKAAYYRKRLKKHENGFILTKKGRRTKRGENVILVKDKATCALLLADEDIARKEAQLLKIANKEIATPSRNSTNRRIDHVLTNLSETHLKELRYVIPNGESSKNVSLYKGLNQGVQLGSIDLKNSQFNILTNILEGRIQAPHLTQNIVGYKRHSRGGLEIGFKWACYQGRVYETIGKELGIERKEAKGLMFQVLFGDYGPSKEKDKLRTLYPGVVEFVDGYKKDLHRRMKEEFDRDPEGFKKRYATKKTPSPTAKKAACNALSKMLQNVESEIFVDDILYGLQEAGYQVLSKHDSILCISSEKEEVEAYVRERLDVALGKGRYELKVEVVG